jgi:hypothetical protein
MVAMSGKSRPSVAPTLAVVALFAASCATPPSPGFDPATDHFEWLLFETDTGVSLAYGVQESDNIAIAFECREGQGSAKYYFPLTEEEATGHLYGETWSTSVRLRSGRTSGRHEVQAEISELGPGATGAMGFDDPVLGAFLRSGRIGINDSPEFGATADERIVILRFAELCR